MKEKMFSYEAPEVEVLEVQVEKGFATSAGLPSWEGGNELQSGPDLTSF